MATQQQHLKRPIVAEQVSAQSISVRKGEGGHRLSGCSWEGLYARGEASATAVTVLAYSLGGSFGQTTHPPQLSGSVLASPCFVYLLSIPAPLKKLRQFSLV